MNKPKRTCELWYSKKNDSYAFFPNDLKEIHKGLEEDAELILSVEANTWKEACQKWYDHLGWGEYKDDETEKLFEDWPFPFNGKWFLKSNINKK